jgi:hypothetical protein
LKYILGFLSQPKRLDDALIKLPNTVGKLYEDIMHRIEKGGDTDRDLAVRTLSWILHSTNTRPLKMNELRELLVIEDGDNDLDERQSTAEDIIAVCQSLVVCDLQSNVVRFTHFTVQEFLNDKYRDKLLPSTDLAKVCLTYLTFDIFELGPCANKESFKE